MSGDQGDTDLAISSGRVIGCSITYRLARAGLAPVTLAERHEQALASTPCAAGLIGESDFLFILSFDEVVIVLFLSSPTVVPLTKRMWDGIFWGFEPTLPAILTLLVLLVVAVLSVAEALRGRAEATTRSQAGG